MVKISKWIILGVGLVAAGLFFREAAGSSLSQTLARTGISGREVGGGIGAVGGGIGEFGVRLLDPFFSLADLIKKFGNIFPQTTNTSGETLTTTTSPAIDTTGGVSAGLPVGSTQTPTDWFNPLPAAYAETSIIQPSVGGTDIQSSVINWAGGQSATLPLSQEARDYYSGLGVSVSSGGGGGGSNASTGGGGGYAGGSISSSVGSSVSWGG